MKKTIQNFSLTLVFLLVALVQTLAQTVVNVGSGSYASFPPTHEMDGVFTNIAQNAEIDVAPGETRAIPTNDWWTSLIYDENDQIGGQLWSMPMVVDPTIDGLSIYNPYKWNADGTNLQLDYPVVLKGAGFVANKSIVTNWSDWTVDAKLYQDINNKFITFTAAHGIPYLWTNSVGFTPQIECYHGATYMNSAGANITFPFTGEYFVIRYWDTFYGVHLPPGSNVTQGGLTGNLLTVNFPAGQNYIIFSALPNAAAAATMHANAYVKPTNSNVSWSYNTGAGTINSTWNLTTTNLRGAALNTVMQGFLPHQYRTATASNVAYNGMTYSQSRGLLRMATGNSFTFTHKFNGILPHYKAPMTLGSETTPYDAAKMNTLINNYTTEILKTTPYGAADTYWGGKDLVRLAKYMLMAKETNHPNYTTLLNTLKSSLTNWFTYTPGETERYFAWYPKWKALIGFNESYYSGVFTDNHFHYGYFIQAAALVGMADPDYVNQYSGILTMIAKQYANWDKADGNFPFMRTFDPWMGHSYAGGVSSPSGNNQESTSEAMQSWHALFFLGAQLSNNGMRDAGAFGYMSESKATLEYWFNRNNDVWPATYNNAHDVVGILWPGGYVYGTYFGIDPQWIHGIQMLPASPGFHFFNQGFTKAQANTYYNSLMSEIYAFNVAQGNTARTDGGVVTEAEIGHDWANVLLGFRMMFDPQYVTQKLAQYWNSSDQEEKDVILYPYEGGTTYYYAHALQNLGEYRTDYHMSIPTSAAYFNATTGQTNYVVYNPLPSAQTCTVYQNGAQVASFSVPARTLYSSLSPSNNTPPTVSVTSPANNATFPSPSTITINATASDPGGSVTSVAFYNGSTLLGTDNTSPYSYAWTNVTTGTYAITARATDNGGLVTTSSPVNITVGNSSAQAIPGTIQAESYSAMNGIQTETTADAGGGLNVGYIDTGDWMDYSVNVATAGSYTVAFRVASVSGGAQVQLRSGATVLATANVAATGGWQTWTTVNATATLAAGTQTLRVHFATGGMNLNWIQFTGTGNTAPTVSITAPANGATFNAPATVTLNANAADPGGSVTSVAFYNGATLLGTDNTNPYSITWTNVAAGSYSITARATDNGGLTTTSSPVNITIGNSSAQAIPGTIQAESYTAMSGVQTEATGDTGGGLNVGFIETGDWMDYSVNVATAGSYTVAFRVASAAGGAQVQLRSGATVRATANIAATGGWQTYTTLTATASLTAGTQTLRIHAATGGFNINWIQFTASAPSVNLALNKPVVASSNENVTAFPPAAAVDGNLGTRWASAAADPQWIYVDLGATYNVNRVKITWETAMGRNYLVQIGANTSTWTTLRTVTANTTAVNDHTGLSGSGRYIRIYGTARNTVYGYSIWELEVYGTSGARMTTEENASGKGDTETVSFYPNPADDNMNIEGVEDGTDVIILSTTGAQSIRHKLINNSIDISALPKGAYVVQVNKNGKLIRKILIRK
jgi:endoglucanase Acf2